MTKDEIIRLAVEAVREYDKKQSKSRHDKRLRNTKLLLENYSLLEDHCSNAVYDRQQLINESNVVDVLDAIESCDKDTYIESIKKSTVRTKIILSHIDEMIKLYEAYCEKSKHKEDVRRCRIIKAYYFTKIGIADIAENEGIDERTVFRDMKDAREKLSALIFGIDGLHNVS